MDESYIHKSYNGNDNSIWDPLKWLVRSYIAKNEKAEIICQAELGGHKVLFIPHTIVAYNL
jgi:hypothetical protein